MMRTLGTIAVLLCIVAGLAFAQYPEVTIRQLQEVPLDSLLVADSLQNTAAARWTLQVSPYYQDTVTITAVVIIPAKVATFTQMGFTMLLADTSANPFPWGSIIVRVGAQGDTNQAILDGFFNFERGDIIRMTGRVDEFPAGNMNSLTQFVPIPTIPIELVGTGVVPAFVDKTVPDFYTGLFPNGKVRYSTGEPYESVPVNLQAPLTVDARVNLTRGTFSVVDDAGNQITDYDASRYFTFGSPTDHPYGADSVWLQDYPVPGSRVTTLRGFINTVSGSENPRGYRVSPMYYGDVEVGLILPGVASHRRNPVVVSPDSSARISVTVSQPDGSTPIDSIALVYSINNGPPSTIRMSYQSSDSTYNASIPQQTANTFVHYFVALADSFGNTSKLASSAFGGSASDTSQGFFFYTVLNRPLTIQDIQQTPYKNGRTGYLGGQVSVSGIVTADTAHLGLSPLNVAGTSTWYMQNGNAPWSGIWFVPPFTDSLTFLKNGDSVTVTGTVAEAFDVTQISNVSSVIVHSSGNPEPAAVVSTTGNFGPIVGNGTPSAERYEGMLVQINNAVITDIAPVFSDPTEFQIDDGSGPMLVRRDGTHHFSNVEADSVLGLTIVRVGNQMSTLTGIVYYSFNRYKLEPRSNSDWGTITGVAVHRNPGVPDRYALRQNYPNPFNPSTIIEYSLPKPEHVTLKIYNLLGQEVRTLVDEVQSSGNYSARFDAASLATGMYFYALRAGEFSQVKKMLLVK